SQLGVLQTAAFSAQKALLIAEWGPTTLYLNGAEAPDAEMAARLAAAGVAVEPAPIARLEGERQSLASVVLADGRKTPIDALYIAPRSVLNSPIAEQLGCAVDEGPLGPTIRTDA